MDLGVVFGEPFKSIMEVLRQKIKIGWKISAQSDGDIIYLERDTRNTRMHQYCFTRHMAK